MGGGLKKAAQAAVIGAAAACAALGFTLFSDAFSFLESPTWSWRVRFFAAPGAATDRIKIVLLDQKSLDWARAENGWSWPWPREVYGALTSFFKRCGAHAVVFDFAFSEPSRYQGDDEAFGAAIAEGPPFVTGFFLGRSTEQTERWPDFVTKRGFEIKGLARWLKAHPDVVFFEPRAAFPVPEIARRAAVLGNFSAAPGKEAVYRKVACFKGFDGKAVPVLGLAAYLAAPDVGAMPEIEIREGELSVAGRRIPIDSKGRTILRYRGPVSVYRLVSAAAVIQSELQIQDGLQPTIKDLESFKDSYVFFGPSAPGLYDLKSTPVADVFPGVGIHATILDNFLSGDFLAEAPFPWVAALTFLLTTASAWVMLLSRKAYQSTAVFCIFFLLPCVVGFAAYPAGYWWPIAAPTLGVLLSLVGGLSLNYATEGRRRRFIKRAFTHYLSPQVIETILQDPSRLELGGERRELSIFFSDLEKFSTISERMDPQELTLLLNDYLSDMTDIILEEGGTLDKYEGDAIIAFWNAPLEQRDHAARAVRAALRCQRKLSERRDDFLERTGAVLKMRIGLNTGPVVVGNMGSGKRFDYTILGDAANLASRLEGANKAFGTYFMASESTWLSAGDGFIGRELGLIRVVGRKTPVRVFEPLGFAGERAPDWLAAFEEGLRLVREAKWEEALSAFETCEGDPAAEAYARKCRELAGRPEAEWDGIWNLSEK